MAGLSLRAEGAPLARTQEAVRTAEEAVVPVVPTAAKASTGRAARAIRDVVARIGVVTKEPAV